MKGIVNESLLIKTITSLFFGKCVITYNKFQKNNRNQKNSDNLQLYKHNWGQAYARDLQKCAGTNFQCGYVSINVKT